MIMGSRMRTDQIFVAVKLRIEGEALVPEKTRLSSPPHTPPRLTTVVLLHVAMH